MDVLSNLPEEGSDSDESNPVISPSWRSRSIATSQTDSSRLTSRSSLHPFHSITATQSRGKLEGVFLSEDEANMSGGDRNVDDTKGRYDEGGEPESFAQYMDPWRRLTLWLQHREDPRTVRTFYPPSLQDQHPSLQPQDEWDVLQVFLKTDNVLGVWDENCDFRSYSIQNFFIYNGVHRKDLPGQLESLHVVASEQSAMQFFMDGVIEHNIDRRYVQRVRIQDVSIGGLQDLLVHSVEGLIFVRTRISKDADDIWYRLQRPGVQYTQMFNDFLWVANLFKYVVDYLDVASNARCDITLDDFRSKFLNQLIEWHSSSDAFQLWHRACGAKTDLRQHMARFADFLRDQIWSLNENPDDPLREHSLWRQICPHRYHDGVNMVSPNEQTIVTPGVKAVFCKVFPDWSEQKYNLLRAQEFSQPVELYRQSRIKRYFSSKMLDYAGGISPDDSENISLALRTLERVGILDSRIDDPVEDILGKLVIVRRNDLPVNDPNFKISYAWVYSSAPALNPQLTNLSVVWLLPPEETLCANSYYPIGNELFFSDECHCEPIFLRDVMAVFGISLGDHARGLAEFFVRSVYNVKDECFVRQPLDPSICTCKREERSETVRSIPAAIPSQEFSLCRRKIKSLSLFSGAGFFDRGLEESGFIETICSIDTNPCAIQTNRANQKGQSISLEKSVNGLLEKILSHPKENPRADGECVILLSGEVDMIIAGTPCPGFSIMNAHKANKKSQKIASLIASTLSYVETILPPLVLIENVPNMDSGSPSACSQTISYLVALGYQVRVVMIRACDIKLCDSPPHLEAPQKRYRLFILAAAPSLTLPEAPSLRESLPPTVADAISRLLEVENDRLINLLHPDHIPVMRFSADPYRIISIRRLVQKIPTEPPGMNLVKSQRQGLLDEQETVWLRRQSAERKSSKSRALERVNYTKPFPTILTRLSPMDSRIGSVLHPWQHRFLTLDEVRIAQGIPNYMVLLGPLHEQLRMLGNGVAFPVGHAWGRAIGESLVSDLLKLDGLETKWEKKGQESEGI